jgi:hypothetical protein
MENYNSQKKKRKIENYKKVENYMYVIANHIINRNFGLFRLQERNLNFHIFQ